MSWAVTTHSSNLPLGGVRLVEAVDIPATLADAERAGLLPISIEHLGPAWRGRLALAIEAAVEEALARRGACPSGVGAATSLEGSLADQLYRARLLELRGLALGLTGLGGIANLGGILDAEDSAVLRFLLDAAERAPLRLIFSRDSGALEVYGPPRPLADLLCAREPVSVPGEGSRTLAPEVGASVAAMELSEPAPAVVERDGTLALESPKTGEVVAREAAAPPQSLAAAVIESATEPPPIARSHAAPPREQLPAVTAPAPRREPRPRKPEPEPAEIVEHATIAVPPLYPNARDEWRGWVAELSSARGAKPLAAIERMFTSSYVPLSDALLHGIADGESEGLVAKWAASFARSYEEAFDALRVRGKRPTMVLDAPEIALRIGRLHGARSVQLLLVDAMRFDLGLRIEQRVRALLGQQAALAERLLLWSALPSTTEVQLELIGRGPEGLAEPARGQGFEVPVARGRAATSLRRVKTGHRELLKLDLVEARLSEPGPSEAERLDSIADEAARVLSDYLAKQAPRTLVLAFGDHGFLLDRLDATTTRAARHGGSSPEEVLVPAFAWLVGGVH